ncbi:DUF5117 domain-containing protein [Ilyomonas limi]|uniref:DUF5117 domain-containing protein n=1 Tax=Ilyomonas limi TaxID=2575867 RepID=A0A4U3LAR0_9BACT|nr:zinc-dependent metalloprotease [Ilyomonas limi]TKK71534.1 DUF5117 domain-containing protein [Ilyomonas limi]
MKKSVYFFAVVLLLSGSVQAQKKKDKDNAKAKLDSIAAIASSKEPEKKASIADKIKSSRKYAGLFTLYQDTVTGSVQMYITKDQLGKDFIYQSFSMGGPTQLFLNQNMIRTNFAFKIKKSFDKLEFSEENTNFYYDANNAVSKAANVDVAAAVFYADKIAAQDSAGYLVPVDGLLLGDKLDPVKPVLPPTIPPGMVFNLGSLNSSKSKYDSLRSFPENTDILVSLAYDNPAPFNTGEKDITDARYVRVRMQHSFLAVPQNDFRARRDDPRVGYFGAEVDDLTSTSYTPYKDFISRWYLKKKDESAALSEPVEPIVFWIENTTPVELRPIIKAAGEKWNEAFEKAGFKNAVVMKEMPDTATWDPADVRYNVIRWVSSPYPSYGAIGPSFFNPLTGQILGADITIEWQTGAGIARQQPLYEDAASYQSLTQKLQAAAEKQQVAQALFGKNHLAACTLANELAMQYQSGISAVETMYDDATNEQKAAAINKMHEQFLYYLVLHEMGHTLGLNHNMKASQMLSPAQLNDTALTHTIGLQGSVMDYPAVNVSLDKSKQGDFYTIKTGPYDWWAIEYGYTPFTTASEEAGLKKILSRSTDPQLVFGNDADDMRSPGNGIDPRVMINDLSNDMAVYAEDRFKLVNTIMPKLKQKFAKPDQSYQELRGRYGTLLNQRYSMASALTRYIGGVYVDRSFPGQNATVKPFTPVPEDYQKKALALLSKYIYAPDAFNADSALYPYLQIQRRSYDFFGNTEDFKPQNAVRMLQESTLDFFLHPTTLKRISNSSLYGNTYSLAEVMSDLTKAVFSADLGTNVNLYRQNLQTLYVDDLSDIVKDTRYYDYVSKAAALASLKKIKSMMTTAVSTNEQTKAHRGNIVFMIDKALDTSK